MKHLFFSFLILCSLTVFSQDPGPAGNITGTTSVCEGQNGVSYFIQPIPYASVYTWNYTGTGFTIVTGAGTNNITTNFSPGATSGVLSVYGINNCVNISVSR